MVACLFRNEEAYIFLMDLDSLSFGCSESGTMTMKILERKPGSFYLTWAVAEEVGNRGSEAGKSIHSTIFRG